MRYVVSEYCTEVCSRGSHEGKAQSLFTPQHLIVHVLCAENIYEVHS